MALYDNSPAPALPLESWRELLGFSPFHFWGLSNDSVPNILGDDVRTCDGLTRQYAWQQGDAAGRDDIARAIVEAEHMLAEHLGYWPGTRYAEFTVPWPAYPDGRFTRVAPVDALGRRLSVQLPEGEVQALGYEAITLLGTVSVGGAPGATLAYSDADGDTLTDTFTVTLAGVSATLDTDQVALYVAAADRFDGSGRSERWRVRPIRASLSGTTLTVIGRAWTAARPILYEGMPTAAPSGGGGVAGLDPGDAAIYCQSLEVCTRACDSDGETLATAQAVLEWDTRPAYLDGWCVGSPSFPGDNSADPAAEARVVARAGVRDARRGAVLPAAAVRSAAGVWSERYPIWWQPDRVTVRGRFGAGTVDRPPAELARAVAMLAAAVLARPICACADVNRQLYYYQFDLTLAGRQEELYSTRDPDLDNPFGTRRGAVMAWKSVKRLEQLRSFTF